MRYLMIISCLFFFMGCQAVSKAISYTQSNPLVVNVVTRQSVVRFVNAGESHEDKVERAARLHELIQKLDHFLQGNPKASAKTIMAVLSANISLESLSIADRLLVGDIMSMIEYDLLKQEQAGFLDHSAVIRIRVLLRTAEDTLALYQ